MAKSHPGQLGGEEMRQIGVPYIHLRQPDEPRPTPPRPPENSTNAPSSTPHSPQIPPSSTPAPPPLQLAPEDEPETPSLPNVTNWRLDNEADESEAPPPGEDDGELADDIADRLGQWVEEDMAEEDSFFAEIDELNSSANDAASSQSSDFTAGDEDRIESFPRPVGRPCGPAINLKTKLQDLVTHPWHPFYSAQDYQLARWFIRSSVAKIQINAFFNSPISHNTEKYSFASAYTLDQQLDLMPERLPRWRTGWIGTGRHRRKFYYRDVLEVIMYLISQTTYARHFRWEPFRRWIYSYDKDGNLKKDANGQPHEIRRYTDIWDSDWAWEVQHELPELATLLPLILSSDATQLTTFGGMSSLFNKPQ